MLKIGVVRWRGKCSRHPMFDPVEEGRGAIRGGCPRCESLVEIQELHTRMLAIMKSFAPPQKAQKKRDEFLDRQASLFSE